MHKVSIVVPIYKVEDFIYECVQSIQNQTYKNLEIILVNDGSPDGSLKLVNDLKAIDKRILVIDVPNGGVSKARNIGLSYATGEYVVFVDADDTIERDFVAYMLSLASRSESSFVMSKYCRNFPNETNLVAANIDTVEILNSEEATILLMSPGVVTIGCWNKMFSVGFLKENNIKFNESLFMGEGLSFIIDVASKAKEIVVGNRLVYNYRQDNVNSATTVINVAKYLNAIKAIDCISNKLTLQSDALLKEVKLHRTLNVYSAINAIYKTKSTSKFNYELIMLRKELKDNILLIMNSRLKFISKITILMTSLHPNLTFMLSNVKSKLINR